MSQPKSPAEKEAPEVKEDSASICVITGKLGTIRKRLQNLVNSTHSSDYLMEIEETSDQQSESDEAPNSGD